jgi:hypothetical protein
MRRVSLRLALYWKIITVAAAKRVPRTELVLHREVGA